MKTKKPVTNKVAAKKRITASKKRTALVFAKHPVLKHLRIVHHKHTGKLIHHQNTSHAALMIVLVLVGFFLYISAEMASASSSGSVSVGLRVEGPAPSIGATITSPEDGAKIIDKKYVDVSGTCAANTFVVVSNDNLVAGSTTCSADGIFSVQIQLSLGKNVISALNYDNLNQSGPVTPSVNVFVSNKDDNPSGPTEPVITPDDSGTIDVPAVPSNPSIIPGVNSSISSCGDYKVGNLPTGGEPHILIVCMPRLFSSDTKQVLGIIAWGGTTPYVVSIDWGDGSEPTLLSVSKPGYYTVEFNYAVPNTYRITSYLSDSKGKKSVVHASIQVSGTKNNPTTNTTTDNDIFGLPWFMQSIPLYLTVVAITVGFWSGDVFSRHYGAGKKRHHRRKAA